MYKVIPLGDGTHAAGSVGEYVVVPIPEYIRLAEYFEYQTTLLHWINSMARVGLAYHGNDFNGGAIMRIE